MQISTYLRGLRRRWVWLVVGAVLGAAVGAAVGFSGTPVYSSTLSIYISVDTTGTGTSQLSDDQLAERRANSYVQLLSSERLAKEIIDQNGLDLTPRQVQDSISGAVETNTVLFDVDVRDTDKQRSFVIAQAIADQFPKFISGLGNANDVSLTVTSGPTLHQAPVSPRKTLDLVAGLLAGLLIGVVVAVVRDVRDDSFDSPDTLSEATGRPVLGEIPFEPSLKDASPLLVGEALHSIRAEAYRQVRTNLQFADVDNPPRVIVVTSAQPGEGKSSTAVNLALLFAEAGRDTLLLEADLRRPLAAAYLGVGPGVGLTEALSGAVSFEEALQEWGPQVTLMSCGQTPPNPSELLGSRNMGVLLKEMRDVFQMVIIDSPPLGPVTDAAVLAPLVDGFVVVVREGKTGEAELDRALQRIDAVDAKVFGFAMMRAKGKTPRNLYRGYSSTPPPAPSEPSRPRRRAVTRRAAPPEGANPPGAEGETRVLKPTPSSRLLDH